MSRPSGFRIGIDIGGTFTDAVIMNEANGDFQPVKVASTPSDPSVAFMEALDRTFQGTGITAEKVNYIVHGTTVATNTIIEGRGARVGMLCSEGFRDLFEIAWQIRPELYNLFYDKPRPIIRRYLCLGVPERIDAEGRVLVPLDEGSVRQAARKLKDEGIQALVICFLHSYLDAAHERRAGEIVHEECPNLPISLSSEICPEYREYPRASTAAINAVLQPGVGAYIERLERRLETAVPQSGLYLMTSSGGIIASSTAREHPVQLVESGPAAGVVAAAFVGRLAGFDDLIALDIGGTTAKAALIQRGLPRLASEFEVGDTALAMTTRNRGGGYPIRTPVIDLVEIGAGGGSIGHVDPGGALGVGPQSAGADPGPACYGRGGSQPTLTDANLALGRINARYFLGGELPLEEALARKAIEEQVAHPLGMTVEEAAFGMLEIGNAAMTGALQLVSVQKSVDPRDFVFVAFGGAGPLHAVSLAQKLQIGCVLVPPSPGVTSALGLLVTDLRHDYVRTWITPTDQLDRAVLEEIYHAFEAKATELLLKEGVRSSNIRFIRELEMRYRGQSYELPIPLAESPWGDDLVQQLNTAFFTSHRQNYGFAVSTEPTEIVNVRLSAIGSVPRPKRRAITTGGPSAEAAIKETRAVFMTEPQQPLRTRIYDRYRLKSGNLVAGPAIVEEVDSTTVISPGWIATVDAYGNLLIRQHKVP